MNLQLSGLAARATQVGLATFVIVSLASCGGGAVSAPTVTVTPGPLAIFPATATLYANLPTTFTVSGGNGTYLVTSSDQTTVPVIAAIAGSAFTVIPNSVASDTVVTLTVRDSGATTPATAALVVKPRTVSNVVTVIPSASQSAVCGTSVCAGGDAEVRVILSQGGVPLQGREARFDVVSGDFRIITSAAGLPEALALSGTTITDSSGTARIRIRVLNDAGSQTGLLQITDVSSGSFQRTAVAIAPSSNAPLNAQPSTIAFQGLAANTCASGISADVIVFGGRPPYQISQPGSFDVSPPTVLTSGGRFAVTANGQCSSGSRIAVVDSNGATVSVTASNKLSEAVPIAPAATPFVVSPTSVRLASCADVANVNLSGGSGNFMSASGNSFVAVTVNGNIGSIKRVTGSPAPALATVNVQFSDGKTSQTVVVTLIDSATGTCL